MGHLGCGGIHVSILAHKRFIVNSGYAYFIYHHLHMGKQFNGRRSVENLLRKGISIRFSVV